MHILYIQYTLCEVLNEVPTVLVNERPRAISLDRLRDLICRVYQSVNIDEKIHSAFQITFD